MSSEFFIGDIIKLTGREWAMDGSGLEGRQVQITEMSSDEPVFTHDGKRYSTYDEEFDYSATLVHECGTQFRVGDLVELTGSSWSVAMKGSTVEVEKMVHLHSRRGAGPIHEEKQFAQFKTSTWTSSEERWFSIYSRNQAGTCDWSATLVSRGPGLGDECKTCRHKLAEHHMTGSADKWPCRKPSSKASEIPGAVCACQDFEFPETVVVTPTKGSPKMATKAAAKTYTLPDGREYLTRELKGYENDVIGLRELATMGKHVLLLGEPGCGKSALLRVAHPKAQNEIGHSKLTAWDMLWRPRPMPDGTIIFDPSPLNRAVTNGLPFYFDEIMRSSEDALTPLFSAMDGTGFIIGGNLDGTDLPVKKGFTVIGASNPLVRGAFLPDAIASRFHILTVETSENLLERLELDERLLVAWRNLSGRDGGEMWRPSIREMLSAQSFIDAGNLPQAAFALTGWRIPARDRSVVAGIIAPLFGVRVSDLGGVIR